MTSSQRIILNTLATYTRSVLTAGLALFSSRWILNALGQTDFGLYTLVGTLIIFISILNGVLGGSAGRFFAFAIGKGDRVEVNQWFNTAFTIHAVLPVVLISIGWPIGEFCIRHVLNIPPERVSACCWIFRLSLVGAFFSMLAVPYVAMFTAKQRIAEIALWGLIQAISTFILAFSVCYITTDRLIVYAAGMVSIISGITLVQVLRAKFLFPECRLVRRQLLNRERIREIFGFACWSLIGCSGSILRDQGTAILLNIFYGPKMNAAYGIANQVSNQTGTFAQAMIGAMSPEITATAGRNDQERLLALTLRASKFASLLALLFAIPLFIEMDYILRLWLKTPPAHSTIFCQLILVSFLLDKIAIGHVMAVNAKGKIAMYQATVGGILLLTLPVGYLLLKMFALPAAALVAFVITSSGCLISRILWGKHLIGVRPGQWFTGVFVRCLLVAAPTAALTAIPKLLLPATPLRLGITTLVSLVATAVLGWFVGFTAMERHYVIYSLQRAISRYCRPGSTVFSTAEAHRSVSS